MARAKAEQVQDALEALTGRVAPHHDPFDEFETAQASRPGGRKCGFPPIRAKLSPERLEALAKALLATDRIGAPTIVDVLKGWGINVTADLIRRHRPGFSDPCQSCGIAK